MATQYDAYGRAYDDVHPAFIILDDNYYYYRAKHTIITRASVDYRMEDAQYTPANNEIGCDNDWLVANTQYTPNSTDCPYVPDTGVLTITDPTDGSTRQPVYDITGVGADPNSEVQLWDSTRNPEVDQPNSTTTADGSGAFAFAGNTPANAGDITWTVKSGDETSSPVTVTTFNPMVVTAEATDLSATATFIGGKPPHSIDWGDGTTVPDAVSPATHDYAAAGTFTITVKDMLLSEKTADLTVTAPAQE